MSELVHRFIEYKGQDDKWHPFIWYSNVADKSYDIKLDDKDFIKLDNGVILERHISYLIDSYGVACFLMSNYDEVIDEGLPHDITPEIKAEIDAYPNAKYGECYITLSHLWKWVANEKELLSDAFRSSCKSKQLERLEQKIDFIGEHQNDNNSSYHDFKESIKPDDSLFMQEHYFDMDTFYYPMLKEETAVDSLTYEAFGYISSEKIRMIYFIS